MFSSRLFGFTSNNFMKLKVVRIEYANRISVAKNLFDNLILEYSEKLLFMHDTRFRFIEWAAKIVTKTDCVVCICNTYI